MSYQGSLVNDAPAGFAVLQELYEFVRSHRFTKKKTLNELTRCRSEKAKLIEIFNAFGHDLDMQVAGQPYECRDNGSIFLITGKVVDQAGIELQYIDRKLFEIRQTGHASPKVIDAYGDAD